MAVISFSILEILPTASSREVSTPAPGLWPPKAEYSVYIAITNSSYLPSTATVVLGINNSVVWFNLSDQTQSVTANNALNQIGEIDSQAYTALLPGTSWNYTFASPGIFYYDDQYSAHDAMQGSVTVETLCQVAPGVLKPELLPCYLYSENTSEDQATS